MTSRITDKSGMLPNGITAAMDQLIAQRDRATEILMRVRRDIDLLAEAQHQLTIGLNRVMRALNSAPHTTALPSPATPRLTEPPFRGPRFIRLKELRFRIGMAPSGIWQMVKDGRFPKPRRIGERAVAWLEEEVIAWIAARRPSDEVLNVDQRRPKPRRD